jgi:hypothetical protein
MRMARVPGRLLLVAALLALGVPGARARDFALIVGIDDYRQEGQELADLRFAENDAAGIARYFDAQGVAVTLLLGADGRGSKRDIAAAVAEIAGEIGPEDNFVFSFSGHGIVRERDGVRLGYLVTRDPPGEGALISAGELQEFMRQLDVARHQLFIFASCYGGLLGQLPRRGAGVRFDSAEFMRNDLEKRRARQYLSAGGDDQQVLDSGPGGLSWFTYFLLKGLEPGVVSSRDDGLLTFSEWASFVQAYSANPYHTPAFGTLSADEGGQFVLRTTDRGAPQLPRLPEVTQRTLRDLGFLSRGDQELVRFSVEDMKRPIDELFRAWEGLDLDLYLGQFDRSVVQTGVMKGGRRFSRGYGEIAENRRKLFPRLDAVVVKNYEVMFQGTQASIATFGVRYSMEFRFKDGRVTRETNVKECYAVGQDDAGAWRIVRNDDYQARICG